MENGAINLSSEPTLSVVKSTFKFMWFKLLIDSKEEINVFQIKRNKPIYLFTNFIVFLCYLTPLSFLIADIIIKCINMNFDYIYFVIAYIISFIFVIGLFSLICGTKGLSRISIFCPYLFKNLAYLIHSKYLIDKYIYFYNVDLTYLLSEKVNKYINIDNFYSGCVEYLDKRNISELSIINNNKNRGIINKIYLKDKDKAIKLMKLSIQYFYIITNRVVLLVIITYVIIGLIMFIPFYFIK